MFGLFKKKKDKAHVLGAPAKGKAVSLKEVSDPTFSEGILGDGVAVIPSEGKIYAPADGTIGMVFDTLHAISLTTDFGAEVLIHVGLDTVQLKGEGFEGHVKAGDTVKKGQVLGIIEAMKLMNEIESEYDGVIEAILVNNEEVVEYGQPLFRIK